MSCYQWTRILAVVAVLQSLSVLAAPQIEPLTRRQHVSRTTDEAGVLPVPEQSGADSIANCLDPFGTTLAKKCWTELNLTNFVQEWVSIHPCDPTEGAMFGKCFLNQVGFVTTDCSYIGLNSCIPPTSLSEKLPDPVTKVKAFYVAYNIHGKVFPTRLTGMKIKILRLTFAPKLSNRSS